MISENKLFLNKNQNEEEDGEDKIERETCKKEDETSKVLARQGATYHVHFFSFNLHCK
jgi:hypothetical protein